MSAVGNVRAEYREQWQARALAHCRYESLGMVVLSVLAHSYDERLLFWLHAVDPDFISISTPFICSAGRVDKTGRVVAQVVWDDLSEPALAAIFRDERHMQTTFRKLADKLKLSDADRVEMFAAVKKWVTCDTRLDPTMDPQDPDAKRLTLN